MDLWKPMHGAAYLSAAERYAAPQQRIAHVNVLACNAGSIHDAGTRRCQLPERRAPHISCAIPVHFALQPIFIPVQVDGYKLQQQPAAESAQYS